MLVNNRLRAHVDAALWPCSADVAATRRTRRAAAEAAAGSQ
jgi:hypothetical protein